MFFIASLRRLLLNEAQRSLAFDLRQVRAVDSLHHSFLVLYYVLNGSNACVIVMDLLDLCRLHVCANVLAGVDRASRSNYSRHELLVLKIDPLSFLLLEHVVLGGPDRLLRVA